MNSYRSEVYTGIFLLAWVISLVITACESPKRSPQEAGSSPVEEASGDSSGIQTLPGFVVQQLYSVPRGSQGTWIALTVDLGGRLIASDQSNEGFYRISVTEQGENEQPEVDVEEITMPASGAHGLAWAFGHLYANINGRGLYRLRDTDENGRFDVMEFLGGPEEEGDHGNHAVLPTPDGDGLFVINGNYTPAPETASSRLSNWEEDILLPRQWDARGNARGVFAPGGYIARIDPKASEWEMVSIGYRNAYDAAVNPDGELFTFDSDMEWDFGMPWYRPTRLLHVVSGSDYGWRSGSGKWKVYFEDSLPAVLNVGPGSPTGLVFGTGARFPVRYQRALFGLDWTYGTIYAFHLVPQGASYRADAEEFLWGSPLPVTDAVIGEDGALYFVTGGRTNESKLYRVVYRGEQSVAPAPEQDDPEARAARRLRHRLEAFHGKRHPEAVSAAWPHLASPDRFLRHAARVAVESQPVDAWADRALDEGRPQARITGLVALARTGSEAYRSDAIASLLELDVAGLSSDRKLGYLRAMSLVFMRLGEPGQEERERIVDVLQSLLPHEDARVNTELIRLLVYLKDAAVIEKALSLMENAEETPAPDWGGLLERNKRYGGSIKKMMENPPPVTGLEYAFMLRNLRDGWTIEQRRTYFSYINGAADYMGGASYSGFLQRMRNEALRNASEEEHEAVADITGVSLVQKPPFEITEPEGPGRDWSLDEAVLAVADHLNGRNFERGRNAYFAAGCAACHRFNGFGGNIGPDLSTVGLRSSVTSLLEDIIKPNSLISDQYSSSRVTLKNGEVLTGLVVEEGGSLKVYPRDPEQPPEEVGIDRVRSVDQAEVSPMPPGLVNPLNANELRDLVAYLRSGGNPDSQLFKDNTNGN